ncbi:cytochrome P450 [Lentzea tibetensis]|uniref:Cytochrome P450 n=2 Tax=Lentzea tibetensis TaxID=2591470 RepID=A0A563F0R5_9PSEU|nr:cytochrome P450 [Lentzea tibetensis]
MVRASMDGREVWLALGYDAVRQVLSDQRFSREAAAGPGSPLVNQAGANPQLLVSMDPPRHTRVRRLMANAFTPRMVDRLAPRVDELVSTLLTDFSRLAQPADLVRHFAEPLPIMVICELLGVPAEAQERIRGWAGVLIARTAYTPAEIGAAIKQVDGYLAALIEERRAAPDEALISALIAVNDEGGHLSPSELVSNVQLLLIAGHETTVSQIGNSLVTLFQHPAQWELLRSDPALLPQAVDELLRHSRLTSATMPRVAVADTPVGEVVVRAGEAVIPLITVANRDPSAYPSPEVFDITRAGPAPHVGLGHGPHFCLGAQLARLELRAALGGLLARFPGLAPAVPVDELEWKTGLSTRALHSLPVTW